MTEPASVLEAIQHHAVVRSDQPAVADLERSLSYGELMVEARRFCGGMVRHGVQSGDRVALHLSNSVEFVVAALGCLSLGAVFVPLSVSDPSARLATIVGDCAPAIVVTADAVPPVEHVPTFGVTELAAAGPPPTPSGVSPAYIIYTSGTTGTPKGVVIGHRAFLTAVTATVAALHLDGDTRTLCVSPFHFDGSFGTLFPTLVAGGAIVIRPRDALLFPRTFLNAVAGEDITYTGFSPSYLRLLLSSPEVARLARTPLQVVALGGEASSAADVEALWQVAPQVRIVNRYGPTETTIAVTHLQLSPELIASGVVPLGRPHPGTAFHLIDADGALITESGVVGELHISGDQLMDGYWRSAELTASVMRRDVVPDLTAYRTGDLVYRDPDGLYVYVDRADRVLKRSGVRISLVEVGSAVSGLASVLAAAAIPFDNDGRLGIAAFVVAHGDADAAAVAAAVRGVLPDVMMPDRFVLVGELPLTAAGKLNEPHLLARAGLSPPVAAGFRRCP